MRILAAAVIVAFMTGPFAGSASGQDKPIPRYGEKDKEKTQQELQAERDAERAYQRSLGAIPTQKSVDPWGNVRGDSPPKPEAKAPAKKTKTGATSN
ncbi:MAG: hypothetical protein U1E61_05195 [Bradyrhizobium sp.]